MIPDDRTPEEQHAQDVTMIVDSIRAQMVSAGRKWLNRNSSADCFKDRDVPWLIEKHHLLGWDGFCEQIISRVFAGDPE